MNNRNALRLGAPVPLCRDSGNRRCEVTLAQSSTKEGGATKDLFQSVASRIDRPTALIAQSMGGMVAIEGYLLKSDLITLLVLGATSGGLQAARLRAVDWRLTFKKQHPGLPDWFASYSSDLTNELGKLVPVLLIGTVRAAFQ